MKTAYFDCFAGVSGNMILGALVDLGVPVDELRKELSALSLGEYTLEAREVTKQGISGTYVEVAATEDDAGRTLGSILRLIDESALGENIKEQSKRIFVRMGQAEAKVHNKDLCAVHLHEVGAIDTVVDVVGSLVGIKMLGIEEVTCSPLSLGRGWVECQHGWLPIPAPMTAEIIKGVPVASTSIEAELTTPTGAAIITGLVSHFGAMPLLRVQGVGYGAGKKELPVPNLLRVFLGEPTGQAEGYESERLMVLETNIDDMNPQYYEYIMERLFQAAALDVFLTPVQMKKNRPGTLLSVVARQETVGGLLDILLEESTTLGVRVSESQRFCLPRFSRRVETRFGEIRVKVACRGDVVVKAVPEYEDCKRVAKEYGVPIRQVFVEVQNNCKGMTVARED